MTMWVWEIDTPPDKCLCDTCIYNDENSQCCEAEDCFGGDHYENQETLFEPQESEDTDEDSD